MSDICFIGDDLLVVVPQAKDSLGNVVDLTGATIYGYCQPSAGGSKVAGSGSIDSPETDGRSRVLFSRSDTASFVAGTAYNYDVLAQLSSGEIHTIGRGSFVATTRITPQPT